MAYYGAKGLRPRRFGYQAPRWPFTLNKDSPQAQGLVAWYSVPYGLLTLPRDLSGLAGDFTTGTLPALETIPDISQHALRFDGSTTFIRSPTLPVTTWGFTMTMIGQLTGAASAAEAFLIGVFDGSSNTVYTGLDQTSATAIRLNSRDSLAQAVTTAQTVGSDVFHFAGTFEQANRLSYANGVAGTANTTDVGGPGAWDRFTLGRRDRSAASSNTDNRAFDWRVYNRVLSATEIWEQYDPEKRWHLYYELGRRIYTFPTVAGAPAPAPTGHGMLLGRHRNRLVRAA